MFKNVNHVKKNKTSNNYTKQPLEITITTDKHYQQVFLDKVKYIWFLTTHKGHKYVLTIQGVLTKFSNTTQKPNHEANQVVHNFVILFVYLH